MRKFIFFILLLTFVNTAFAYVQDYIKPELGLGSSDNVYQDDLNKKSDFFTWIQTKLNYKLVDSSLTAKANITLYSKEKANNSINYSLLHRSELNFENVELNLGIGGFNYLQSESGSTDESYNNYYATTYLSKSILTKNSLNLNFEPGLKITAYPQLDKRRDIVLFFRFDADWQMKTDTNINPYLELGFSSSNQNYYSKNYLDLGIFWNQKIDQFYKFNIDLYLRNTTYPNRKIVDILFLPRRKGRDTSVSNDTNENLSLTQLALNLIRTDANRELSIGLNTTSESSRSHLEYFNELQILASARWTF